MILKKENIEKGLSKAIEHKFLEPVGAH